MTNSATTTQPEPSSLKKAWRYFNRSARLKCPVCGVSPLFKPVSKVRSVNDWFQTLSGCPKCDYVYDQEPGYFMLAIWTLDYGPACIFSIAVIAFLMNFFDLTTIQLLIFSLIPTFIFAVLIVRHAKAFYLAMDHYFFHK